MSLPIFTIILTWSLENSSKKVASTLKRGQFLGLQAHAPSLLTANTTTKMLTKKKAIEGYPATVLARLTWASKLAQGVETAAVVRKELASSGIQHPLYPGELGDDAVEVFRFGDFVGWIIEG